jgi:hypothetical protein
MAGTSPRSGYTVSRSASLEHTVAMIFFTIIQARRQLNYTSDHLQGKARNEQRKGIFRYENTTRRKQAFNEK